MKKHFWVLLCLPVAFYSCVSSKQFKAEQEKYALLTNKYAALQNDLKACEDAKAEAARKAGLMQAEIDNLNKQSAVFKRKQYTGAFATPKHVGDFQRTGREHQKVDGKYWCKRCLYTGFASFYGKKRFFNMALVMNLKGAIGNLDDQDINIKVDKGVVFIDISDKLLFKSGSYNITDNAKTVLGKVAMVLKNQPDIEFMVEGHTDNVPFKGNGIIKDNWDLSVLRATTVVRMLQNEYGLNPSKMAASGRSEYLPVADNTTAEGKSANRRTRIVILPQLDQFFKLLEPKGK